MNHLEDLVRDSFTRHAVEAPESVNLLAAVRKGVQRQRRRRIAWELVAATVVGASLLSVAIAAPRQEPGAPSEVGQEPSVPPGIGQELGAPPTVLAAAEHLSSSAVQPHPPATVIWVSTTFNAWRRLEGQGVLDVDAPVYVVELRSQSPMVCQSCKGIRISTGRIAILVTPVNSTGPNEFYLGNTDYPLAQLGTVHQLRNSY